MHVAGCLKCQLQNVIKHKKISNYMLNLYSTQIFCLQFSSQDQVEVMFKVQISLSEKVLQRQECGWTRCLLIE